MSFGYELNSELFPEEIITNNGLMKKIIGKCNGELVREHQTITRIDKRIVEWNNLLKKCEGQLTVLEDMIMVFEKQEETPYIEDELNRLDLTHADVQRKIEQTTREIKLNKMSRENALKRYSNYLDYFQLLLEIEGEIE